MLRAFATPHRLRILSRLRQGPADISELALAAELSRTSATATLRALRQLGIIDSQRQGPTVVYAIYDTQVINYLDELIYLSEYLLANNNRFGSTEL
jgi:ArsR family transcriptional regulator, nickel/cobalt-responsive transcriptional repressor